MSDNKICGGLFGGCDNTWIWIIVIIIIILCVCPGILGGGICGCKE